MEGFLLYSPVSISECWPVPTCTVNNNYLDKACVRRVYQHKSRDGGEPYQCISQDGSVLKQLTSKLKTSLAR